MIIENLSQLYPKGYLSKTIGSEATYSIPVDDQFFIVNKAFLSIKEQHLLEALFPISENPTITGNHPWFSYLFQQAKLRRRDLSYVANSNECPKRITS